MFFAYYFSLGLLIRPAIEPHLPTDFEWKLVCERAATCTQLHFLCGHAVACYIHNRQSLTQIRSSYVCRQWVYVL